MTLSLPLILITARDGRTGRRVNQFLFFIFIIIYYYPIPRVLFPIQVLLKFTMIEKDGEKHGNDKYNGYKMKK